MLIIEQKWDTVDWVELRPITPKTTRLAPSSPGADPAIIGRRNVSPLIGAQTASELWMQSHRKSLYLVILSFHNVKENVFVSRLSNEITELIYVLPGRLLAFFCYVQTADASVWSTLSATLTHWHWQHEHNSLIIGVKINFSLAGDT